MLKTLLRQLPPRSGYKTPSSGENAKGYQPETFSKGKEEVYAVMGIIEEIIAYLEGHCHKPDLEQLVAREYADTARRFIAAQRDNNDFTH